MKVVILAGGFGTRIVEESTNIPKPMINIGEFPMIWHIMKYYSNFGFDEFIICLGYKGYVIKEYFINYHAHLSDLKIDLSTGKVDVVDTRSENWKITLVDTGENSMTGGRIKRIAPFLDDSEPFLLTYGDGLSDHDVNAQLSFHKSHGKPATILAVRPSGRFGALDLQGDKVCQFLEKPLGDGNYINGGFFILEKSVIDLIEGDQTVWEQEPLESLAQNGDLHAYQHDGFWTCMDTLRDANRINSQWETGEAPWALWKNTR